MLPTFFLYNKYGKSKNFVCPLIHLFFSPNRPYAKDKINNMAEPHNCKNDTRYVDAFENHHGKAKSHKKRDACHNSRFCSDCHTLFVYERLQMLFIHFCTHEPVVQLLRAL